MTYITKSGVLTIGKHKGKRVSTIPKQWIQWAMTNISGFTAQFDNYRLRIADNFIQARKPAQSSNGKSYMANKGLRKPKLNRFTSRATRIVGATL